MPPRRKGFFTQPARPEDEAARQREVAALLVPRRTVVQDVAVERIRPNPFQARQDFSGVDELAQAIRTQGFTTRLRVRPDPQEAGYFQLVFGERRLRAARLAGLDAVPCEIADHTDAEMIEIGLAENIQRRDLSPLEEAHAFQTMIAQRGYSIRTLAERIGKDKSYLEDRLKLLQVPEDVQQMIGQRPDALRAAREISKIDDPAGRQALIAGVVAGSLTTADVRELVRDTSALPARAHSGAVDVRTSIARDTRALRAIVARWRALAAQGEAERALISEQTLALLQDIQDLVAGLDQ